MDLADLKNSPEIRESSTYKFFLVVVNAFDRFAYPFFPAQPHVGQAARQLAPGWSAQAEVALDGGGHLAGAHGWGLAAAA
jgi:hypothetical protein